MLARDVARRTRNWGKGRSRAAAKRRRRRLQPTVLHWLNARSFQFSFPVSFRVQKFTRI